MTFLRNSSKTVSFKKLIFKLIGSMELSRILQKTSKISPSMVLTVLKNHTDVIILKTESLSLSLFLFFGGGGN